MKNILIIGIGGTGCGAVDIFYKKMQMMGNQSGNNVKAVVLDTDAGDLREIKSATPIVMADPASVGTICDRVGKDYLREWFPCDDKAVRSQEMIRGASQWRKKSYLAFLNLMNKPDKRSAFIGALERMTVDPNAACEVYVVASLAGGTGSGSFIPLALYVKRYLRKVLGKAPIVKAMLALPDIFADAQTPENRVKVYANAYAILRELNAINLVANNYNEGRSEHKKAPIRFKLGNPDEPNVGLLFDSADRSFWTPEAAPFSQIFLLDKVPMMDSVEAHNMILANSLYAMLCTPIGTSIDSELSNHAVIQSQNNGSNAIYASVSTSQISFPKETILDYLANWKALDSCENEWMFLHKATEGKIEEKQQQAKESNHRFTMHDGEYADLFLEVIDDLKVSGANANVLEILDRSLYSYDTETKMKTVFADVYEKKIVSSIQKIIPMLNPDELAMPKMSNSKCTFKSLKAASGSINDTLSVYYKDCIEAIRSKKMSLADAILSFNTEKGNTLEFSIVENLLKTKPGKSGKYIHPVAAMAELCSIKQWLHKTLTNWNEEKVWKALKARDINEIEIPDELLTLTTNAADANAKNLKGNSVYVGKTPNKVTRFLELVGGKTNTKSKNYNAFVDLSVLYKDAASLAEGIAGAAREQILKNVLSIVSKRIDLMIEKYRTFFNRFEKEKENLVIDKNTYYHRDDGIVNSIVNVYSSPASKDAICDKVFKSAGPETDADVEESDNVAGCGVFTACYNAAVASEEKNKNWNEKDAAPFRSLFDDLVASYKKFIAKSESYEAIASYNVIQAIDESVSHDKFEDEMRKLLSTVHDIATPKLQLDVTMDKKTVVTPSDFSVFMVSKETGRYIKKNAERFGLPSVADAVDEDKAIKSSTENFIHVYGGYQNARVRIVPNMVDQTLYCLGGIMDITPVCINKINEMHEDCIYFKNYCNAIRYQKAFDSEMWNPHLGDGLNKRGHLPFLNLDRETECDRKMVKALIYAFQNDKIRFMKGSSKSNALFHVKENGNLVPMKTVDGLLIGRKNIAQIMSWMRDLDEDLVEEWANEFDEWIIGLKNNLPNVSGNSDVPSFKAQLTTNDFIKLLNAGLYDDSERNNIAKNDIQGPGLLAFAYLIKTSEESSRDCDDAERILDVAYGVFKSIIAHRINPKDRQDDFTEVYSHELNKVFEGFATACNGLMKKNGTASGESLSFYSQLVDWINGAGYFLDIPKDKPVDAYGVVQITEDYNIQANKTIMDTLSSIDKANKKAVNEAAKEDEAEKAE